MVLAHHGLRCLPAQCAVCRWWSAKQVRTGRGGTDRTVLRHACLAVVEVVERRLRGHKEERAPEPVTGSGFLPNPTLPWSSAPANKLQLHKTRSGGVRGCASAVTVALRSELSSASGARERDRRRRERGQQVRTSGADSRRGQQTQRHPGTGVNGPAAPRTARGPSRVTQSRCDPGSSWRRTIHRAARRRARALAGRA
jgi:hypothetical protein